MKVHVSRRSMILTAAPLLLTMTIGCPGAHSQVASQSAGGSSISKESGWVYLPVASSPQEADSLFNSTGFEAVSAIGLSFAGQGGAFYSEFLSDNLAVVLPLGYGRMGFGAFVQSRNATEEMDEQEQESLVAETASERFLAAGGNATFYYALPLIAYEAGFNEGPKTIRSQIMFLPRVGLDVPSLNAGTADFSGNLDLGATLNVQLLSHQRIFNFFSVLRAGWVPLASQEFYENLGRESTFSYASIEGGVVLADLIRIGVRGPLAGPSELLRRAPASVSVQLIPARISH